MKKLLLPVARRMRRFLLGNLPEVVEQQNAVLARLIDAHERTQRVLGPQRLLPRLDRLEEDVEAILRALRVQPAELPYPYRLTSQRFRMTSQNEEDGMTLAILREIGPTACRFVEIGSGPNGGNSGFLAREHGWTGLMIDAERDNADKARARFGRDGVKVIAEMVTRENVNDILRERGLTGEIDLLSIDIDGNDYWVWEALSACSPRLVICEYNSSFGPERAVTVPYEAAFDRHEKATTFYYGASLRALVHLGRRKGYRLIATEPAGVNAYFLRDDVGLMIPTCDVETAFHMQLGHWREDVLARFERAGLRLVDIPE